ncbi:hypothetical protein SDRG_11855 [Saprolegnia diclina VS20]|uniref:Fungal lipase-type domain-containing protein n=1 Tax=Saprolegnia diclina (strain VS20) TaxID=1156394 RepID=T0RE43_SAPDV|nr:hypothetical protein SDRG_11855 [Saprolegnia diclina VS20]EQC30538.1 hypothetical protein SDRG_11855 [Saprolegnia diclina VS20]|eukprot:XP_008616131.1 hypothetical protein SDRG_11855 [Saprolegnia diclina VS20]
MASPATVEQDVLAVDIGSIDMSTVTGLQTTATTSRLPLAMGPRRVLVPDFGRTSLRRRSGEASAHVSRRISEIARQAGSLGRSAFTLRRISMVSSTDLKIDALTSREVATTYVLFHLALALGMLLSLTTVLFWLNSDNSASVAAAGEGLWFVISIGHYASYVFISVACGVFARRIYVLPARQPVQETMAYIASTYGVITLGEFIVEASLSVRAGHVWSTCHGSGDVEPVSLVVRNVLNAIQATVFYVVLTKVCSCFRVSEATHHATRVTDIGTSATMFLVYIGLRVYLGVVNGIILDYVPMTNAITTIRLRYLEEGSATVTPPLRVVTATLVVTACDVGFSLWAWAEIAAVRRSFRETFVRNLSKLLIAFNFFMYYNAQMILVLVLSGHLVAWLLPINYYSADGTALRCTGSLAVTFGLKLTIAGWLVTAMYACLPTDAVGLRGWFVSSPNALAAPTHRIRYFCHASDVHQTANFRLVDMLQNTLVIEPRHFVLEDQIEMFNFAYLAYACGNKDYSQDFLHLHRMIGSAEFALADHLHDPKSDTHCLIAHSTDKIIVAFRGSMSWKNYKTDLNASKHMCVDYNLLPAASDDKRPRFVPHNISRPNFCKAKTPWVHGGFWDAYQSVADRVLARLETMNEENPRSMYFTGHSLGGALATLCSLDVAFKYGASRVACTTFGCPRVGGNAYKRVYNARVPANFRFVNAQDPVCHTPLRTLWDSFTEVGTTVVLDRLGNLVVDPNLLEYDLLNRGISGDAHRLTSYQMALFLWCKRAHPRRFEPKFWSHSLQKLREHHGHVPEVLHYLHKRSLFVRTANDADDDRVLTEITTTVLPTRKTLGLFQRPVICFATNDTIEALVAAHLVPSEADAVEVGRVLLVKGAIHMVDDPQVFRHDAYFTIVKRPAKVAPAESRSTMPEKTTVSSNDA